MPLMQSAEYQATIPQKFPIIIHNCANVYNQPIKITTLFSGSSDITGQH